MAAPLDYEAIAGELVRALRGRRSQTALSRRLGHRSNVVYAWEHGRRFPHASDAMRVASVCGIDLKAVLARFVRPYPSALARWSEARGPFPVGAFLRQIRGQLTLAELASRAGINRFSVSRWLSDQSEPRLPDFLRLVEAGSRRMLDFVSLFVDPAALDAARADWEELERLRTLAYEHPLSEAMVRAVESGDASETFAERLGVSDEHARACLDAMARAGAIRWDGARERYVIGTGGRSVDTGRNPERRLANVRFWTQAAVDRSASLDGPLFSYLVFAVSDAELEELRALHASYFRQLRMKIAQTSGFDRIVVANIQLVPLDRDRDGR